MVLRLEGEVVNVRGLWFSGTTHFSNLVADKISALAFPTNLDNICSGIFHLEVHIFLCLSHHVLMR